MCGGCWFRQHAGQMALDMRPRSTCRRLTKAIPAPFMAEACHGPIGGVHYCPGYGRTGPAYWDAVTGVTLAVALAGRCRCSPSAGRWPRLNRRRGWVVRRWFRGGRWCGVGRCPSGGSPRLGACGHGSNVRPWSRLVLRGAPAVPPPHGPAAEETARPRQGGGWGRPRLRPRRPDPAEGGTRLASSGVGGSCPVGVWGRWGVSPQDEAVPPPGGRDRAARAEPRRHPPAAPHPHPLSRSAPRHHPAPPAFEARPPARTRKTPAPPGQGRGSHRATPGIPYRAARSRKPSRGRTVRRARAAATLRARGPASGFPPSPPSPS